MTPTSMARRLEVEEVTDSHTSGFLHARYRYWAKGFPQDSNSPRSTLEIPESAKRFLKWLDKNKIQHSEYHRATGNLGFKLDKIGWNE